LFILPVQTWANLQYHWPAVSYLQEKSDIIAVFRGTSQSH